MMITMMMVMILFMRFGTTWKKANLIYFGKTSSFFKPVVGNMVQFYRMLTLKNRIVFAKRNQCGDFKISLKCRLILLSPAYQALQIWHDNEAYVAHTNSNVPMLQHLYHVDLFSTDITAICQSAVYGPRDYRAA